MLCESDSTDTSRGISSASADKIEGEDELGLVALMLVPFSDFWRDSAIIDDGATASAA